MGSGDPKEGQRVMDAVFGAWLTDGRFHTAREVAPAVGLDPRLVGRILVRLLEQGRLEIQAGTREEPDKNYPGFAPGRVRKVDEYGPSYRELRQRLQAALAPTPAEVARG